jgi:chorismate mutase/prephenate dehydratase
METDKTDRRLMASVEEKLAALRQEIDTVDHQLHDLLMRRCELAVKVGEVKAERQPVGNNAAEGAKFIRPAREALILRRLVGRHTGKLPKAVIVRLWRELISALLQVEGPFAVAVFSPDSEPGFWDIARDHYGSRVAVTGYDRVGLVLGAVQDGNATVGVVPLPREDDSDPWWRYLIAAGAPHVMGRLPFGDGGNQRGNRVEALVIGRAMNEPTGRDRSLLVVEPSREISRSALRGALTKAGLVPTFFAAWHSPHLGADLHLVEVEGFFSPGPLAIKDTEGNDTALVALGRGQLEGTHLTIIGSYAVPFTGQELGVSQRG